MDKALQHHHHQYSTSSAAPNHRTLSAQNARIHAGVAAMSLKHHLPTKRLVITPKPISSNHHHHHHHRRLFCVETNNSTTLSNNLNTADDDDVANKKKAEGSTPSLPPPPEKPLAGDCCGSGCVRCVWDVYFEDLEAYKKLNGSS